MTRENLLSILLSAMLFSTSFAKQQNKSSDSANSIKTQSTIFLSLGIGLKYNFSELDAYSRTIDSYKSAPIIFLSCGIDFWGEQKHIIGAEIIGFKHNYYDEASALQFELFYKRNIKLKNGFHFFPQLGFTLFSNDPKLLLTVFADLGLAYNVGLFDLFLKNSFRYSPPLGRYSPWFINFGSIIKF